VDQSSLDFFAELGRNHGRSDNVRFLITSSIPEIFTVEV